MNEGVGIHKPARKIARLPIVILLAPAPPIPFLQTHKLVIIAIGGNFGMKFRCEGFMACEPLFHRINEMRRCLFGEFIRSNLAPCTLRVDGTLTIAETVGFGIAAERPIFECRDGAASIKPFEFTLPRSKTKKAQLNGKSEEQTSEIQSLLRK